MRQLTQPKPPRQHRSRLEQRNRRKARGLAKAGQLQPQLGGVLRRTMSGEGVLSLLLVRLTAQRLSAVPLPLQPMRSGVGWWTRSGQRRREEEKERSMRRLAQAKTRQQRQMRVFPAPARRQVQ